MTDATVVDGQTVEYGRVATNGASAVAVDFPHFNVVTWAFASTAGDGTDRAVKTQWSGHAVTVTPSGDPGTGYYYIKAVGY